MIPRNPLILKLEIEAIVYPVVGFMRSTHIV